MGEEETDVKRTMNEEFIWRKRCQCDMHSSPAIKPCDMKIKKSHRDVIYVLLMFKDIRSVF